MPVLVRVTGAERPQQYLRQLREGAVEYGLAKVFIGTSYFVARLMETGFRPRGGRTRVSGRQYIRRAADRIRAEAGAEVRAAMERDPKAGTRALIAAGRRGQKIAQQLAPRGATGKVRKSIRVVVGGRVR